MARSPSQAFAELFEQLRVTHGLKAADLARRLDVSPTQVSRWRRGLDAPSVQHISDIADLFGVDRDHLERLAGYRANNIASARTTIDPQIAALLDAERAEVQEDLRGIPQAFWQAVMAAQRSARRLAVDNALVSLRLVRESGVSNPTGGELTVPPSPQRKHDDGLAGPENGTLPSLLRLAVAV